MTKSALPHARLRRLATGTSVLVAASLIVVKLIAYFKTDSMALLSSMLDSSVDLLASMVTAFAVESALRPPDKEHRYGHGKAEPLAALMQAAFITGSSILLAVEAVQRFSEPKQLENEIIGYAVSAFAIVLTIILLAIQSYVIRKTKSFAIAADRMHYIGDIAINIAVGATFALQQITKAAWIDPLFALLIAGSLLYSAGKIFRNALNVLMDRELPDEDREKILNAAKEIEGVEGIHDLRTRTDSGRIFIEVHVELPRDLPLYQAHARADAVSRVLEQLYPNADVLVHQDPKGEHEERLDTRIDFSSPPSES